LTRHTFPLTADQTSYLVLALCIIMTGLITFLNIDVLFLSDDVRTPIQTLIMVTVVVFMFLNILWTFEGLMILHKYLSKNWQWK